MENMLGQSAQIAALIATAYFALLACSGLVNVYLRFHDRLPIHKVDVQALVRNVSFALVFLATAVVFRNLPFFMALGFLLCGVVIFQIFKINGFLKVLKNN